ncbi:MAG: hypothetical protein ACKOED_00090 [Aestuariivirga sp.]|uniref:hypothetical protein n=1 Tax=Aestuariivirga sp. TaxID=2650926 RepID=UPI0038D1BC6F
MKLRAAWSNTPHLEARFTERNRAPQRQFPVPEYRRRRLLIIGVCSLLLNPRVSPEPVRVFSSLMHLLTVQAHPVPESYNACLFRAATEAARIKDHDVEVTDLHGEGFNPLMSAAATRTKAGYLLIFSAAPRH